MKYLFTLSLVFLSFIVFAQYPAPVNFHYSYIYFGSSYTGSFNCGSEPTSEYDYCSHFEWEAPDTAGLSLTLAYYNLYILDQNTTDTVLLTSTSDTEYYEIMGLIGSTWVTAVYIHPEVESPASNVEENSGLPIDVEGIDSKNEIDFLYDKNSQILSFENSSLIKHIDLFDINGKQIMIIKAPSNKVNINNLPDGIYIISIYTEGSVINGRFVK